MKKEPRFEALPAHTPVLVAGFAAIKGHGAMNALFMSDPQIFAGQLFEAYYPSLGLLMKEGPLSCSISPKEVTGMAALYRDDGARAIVLLRPRANKQTESHCAYLIVEDKIGLVAKLAQSAPTTLHPAHPTVEEIRQELRRTLYLLESKIRSAFEY